MVSVPEATSIIQSHLFLPQKEKVGIINSIGRFLAETIYADRDFPPFDRVTMDGVAIDSREFLTGKRIFKIIGVQAAGQPQLNLTDTSSCLEVMTGAMLPQGTDTVVPYENITIENGRATINAEKVSAGEFIHFVGMDARESSALLSPGMKISPAEVALFASVGKTEVEVYRFPRTAIISTGDELVDINKTPLPYQIRQSNMYAIQSALSEIHCSANVFSVADHKDVMEQLFSKILEEHELIILSGGVSRGKYDYVPQVLEAVGIKKLFHQVSQRPGKPFWFGVSKSHTVFALPGNPVSTYMCFYRYIKPWLLSSLGANSDISTAILATDFSFKPALTYFLQVRIETMNGIRSAYPDTGGGSGDFANLKHVDGFLELPIEKTEFKKGEVFPFIPFR